VKEDFAKMTKDSQMRWHINTDRMLTGLRFTLATVMIGTTAFTLIAWAASDFKASISLVIETAIITAIHFTSYSLIFFSAITYARSRPLLPFLVRAISCFALSVIATFLAVLFSYLSALDTDSIRVAFLRTIVFGVVISPLLLLAEYGWERLGQARQEIERRAVAEERQRREAAEARWTSLESRLHPHFVFNTLASIRELLHIDVRLADFMIQRFADLLRFSLDAPQNPLIPLGEEIRMVAGYLEIEQMRLGPRLNWSLDSSEAVLFFKVPSLSLLTLVENAIKHSISTRRIGGNLTVTAKRKDTSLHLQVTDDGKGFAPDSISPGHGLQLLRDRLILLYGSRATLHVHPQNPGVTVELILPAHV